MTILAWVFALVAAASHVLAFVLESLLFHRTAVQKLMLGRPEPAPGVRLWAFNQGFYNLFLAAGTIIGVICWAAGSETVGRTLVIYTCAFMALAGLVLVVSDRRLWRGMIGQSVAPLIAVLAALSA